MELKYCLERVAPLPGDPNWSRTLDKTVESLPKPLCEATLLQINPEKEILQRHKLDVGRLSWVGYQYNNIKLDALEDFEKAGASIGTGLAVNKNFFWIVRSGGQTAKRVSDSATAKALNGCDIWPVGVKTIADRIELEFVASAEDSLWQIFRCWNPLLNQWGIKSYQFEVHPKGRAWEQLDVNQAFLYFDSSSIRGFRTDGFPGGKKFYPWDSKVCVVREGVLVRCIAGGSSNLMP